MQPYLSRCSPPAVPLPSPRPLLVILDMNGTLLHRKKKTNNATCRPNLHAFMDSLLQTHRGMIWTSTMPENTTSLLATIFPPTKRRQFVDVWARDRLRLSQRDYTNKVQVYKNLDWVWQDRVVRKSGSWDQSNTVLVDDSRTKGASHPYNLLEIPEFVARRGGAAAAAASEDAFDEGEALRTVLRQIRVLGHYDNVSSKIREWDLRRRERFPPTEWEKELEGLDDIEVADKLKALPTAERAAEESRLLTRRRDIDSFWEEILQQEEKTLALSPLVLESSSFQPPQQPPWRRQWRQASPTGRGHREGTSTGYRRHERRSVRSAAARA
ncbi:hypothetical protein KEM52_005583 [Ascosphaera acerosa]|nr:hypothetical protein KEM52_005583 [Ascosphaera acerosa]